MSHFEKFNRKLSKIRVKREFFIQKNLLEAFAYGGNIGYNNFVDQNAIVDLSSKAMTIVLLLSLPSILLATFVGLGVSLLQALTQVQEQTLSFAVRLVCITCVLVLSAHWMGIEMVRYLESIFMLIKQPFGR